MTAHILDGRAMGAELKAELRSEVQQYIQKQGRPPGLVVVRIDGDASSVVYSKAIFRIASEIGVDAKLEQLPHITTESQLQSVLLRFNTDKAIQGILVQMPLPAHLSQKMVAELIAPGKDIDGISILSAGNLFLSAASFLPSTAAAVIETLERTRTSLAGKQVVIVGRSNVVGKPLTMMLLLKNATVTVCHSHTVDLPTYTRQADVLIAAVGRAHLITADMVKPGAVVIDVGINVLPSGGIVGDVDTASVSQVAGALTPTPGGIGPLTNIVLMKQCIQAAWQAIESEKGCIAKVKML